MRASKTRYYPHNVIAHRYSLWRFTLRAISAFTTDSWRRNAYC